MKVKNRIKSRQDFQSLIHLGQTKRNQKYIIYFSKNKLGYARMGVSAPKKCGNAVIRNRIRRQIRAMLSELIPLDRSLDLIVVARMNYHPEDNHLENKKDLEQILNLIGE